MGHPPEGVKNLLLLFLLQERKSRSFASLRMTPHKVRLRRGEELHHRVSELLGLLDVRDVAAIRNLNQH